MFVGGNSRHARTPGYYLVNPSRRYGLAKIFLKAGVGKKGKELQYFCHTCDWSCPT
jgi:hypothetical protein